MKKAQLKGTATMSKESTEGMREIETLADKNQFKLANVWIKSNYRWGNIETQVFNLAIEHPEKHIDIQTNTVKYISKINISDVKALTTQSGQVNYLRASEAAASLRSAFIRIENKEKKKFSYINALERCDYENGQFTVVFTDSAVAAGYIFPQRDYTKVLQTVNVLSDATCIRLYQTLRSHCFGHIDKNGYYHYLVGVDELKLRIGLVNVNDPAFKKSEDKFGLDHDIIKLWYLLTYSKMLSTEIFTPIYTDSQKVKKYEYSPFQTMAKYFEQLGYGGIIYSSTVCTSGKNLVLFNKLSATPTGDLQSYIIP